MTRSGAGVCRPAFSSGVNRAGFADASSLRTSVWITDSNPVKEGPGVWQLFHQVRDAGRQLGERVPAKGCERLLDGDADLVDPRCRRAPSCRLRDRLPGPTKGSSVSKSVSSRMRSYMSSPNESQMKLSNVVKIVPFTGTPSCRGRGDGRHGGQTRNHSSRPTHPRDKGWAAMGGLAPVSDRVGPD